jgi:hypothetical protein
MHAGLSRFEPTWLAEFGGFSDRPAGKNPAVKFGWSAVIVLVGFGAWMVFSNVIDSDVTGQPADKTDFASAATVQPSRLSEANPASDASPFNPATAPSEAAPIDGLKISSQSWRRGGLGSKALVTFTLRNDNNYAVGDIGILCAFSRADGSPLTERRQTLRDTVRMKSRKTFARLHVGFINVNAAKAKCSLLSASRV